LTNSGPFHQQLEDALCKYLGVPYISLFCNATIALITSLQSLRITGEVITTPYSFVATSHALLWNGIKPVFVDIDPNSMNIDPKKIEAAITPQTTAILAVHCYGYPCDVDAIQKIADTYNLKVIYDAAHAFGVNCHCGSVLKHGDLSILSFHATKVFNTFEGGAIVCPDLKTKQRIDHLKNFGFADELNVVATGINGKMSEFNAALGLIQLKRLDEAINKRKQIDSFYRERLSSIPQIVCARPNSAYTNNYAYFPVLIKASNGLSRDGFYDFLNINKVYPRKYFYPLISEFSMYRGMPSSNQALLPVAHETAREVLCLPIFPDLSMEDIIRICTLAKSYFECALT
jgi:dTDP-4-amino-4,6-dideoxygalactose transaminase